VGVLNLDPTLGGRSRWSSPMTLRTTSVSRSYRCRLYREGFHLATK